VLNVLLNLCCVCSPYQCYISLLSDSDNNGDNGDDSDDDAVQAAVAASLSDARYRYVNSQLSYTVKHLFVICVVCVCTLPTQWHESSIVQ